MYRGLYREISVKTDSMAGSSVRFRGVRCLFNIHESFEKDPLTFFVNMFFKNKIIEHVTQKKTRNILEQIF